MESVNEVDFFSQISSVSIKNYHDKILVDLQPHLEEILETASAFLVSNSVPSSAVEMASEIKESASVLHLSSSNVSLKTSGRALTVKEPPLEIVIEHPLDEKSLVNLSRLLGEHTPTSLSQEEATSLIALLGKNQVEHLKIKSTGVRFVFRILEQTFRPLYRLPPQFEYFTGRTEELAALREGRDTVKVIAPRENKSVEEKEDKSISQISGTGGIGKSQLANYHARSQFRDKKYDWVIWMTGGEDDQRAYNNLSSQFADLGVALGLDVEQLKDDVLYQLIYDRLSAKGRGLVVIDDAPNHAVVKSFLPERFGHPEMAVLITTRNNHTFEYVLTKILLDVFTLQDAKHYIHRLLKETATDADAEVLALTLDRYPLALTQALAYILNNQCTVAEYCERYTTLRAAKNKYLETPVHEDDPYQLEHQKRKRQFEATMKVVVELSLEQVKVLCKTQDTYERATRVLLATTYLAPESAIPKGLLGKWIPDDENEIQITEVLEAIRTLSLLEEAAETATYRIHQVVQDTLRIEETPEDTEMRLLKWNKILDSYIISSGPKFRAISEAKHKSLEAHLIVLGQYLNRQPRTDDILEAESSISTMAGNATRYKGKEHIAKSYYEHALKCIRQRSTTNRMSVEEGNCLSNLGIAARACGNPQESKRYLNEALVIRKVLGGEDSTVVAYCLMNLGMAACSSGDLEEAKEKVEKALEIFKSKFGTGHADVAGCLSNLAAITYKMGDYKTSQIYWESALPILESTLGPEHVYVGLTLMNLGAVNLGQGKAKISKEYFERALPILETAYGDSHSDVGICKMNLGMTIMMCGTPQMGKEHVTYDSSILQQTLGHLKSALPIFKKTLGQRHAEVGVCLMNLGSVYLSLNEFQIAQEHYKEALPILEETGGGKHADLSKCLVNLATATFRCGDPYTATEYLGKSLPFLESKLGKDHVDVGTTRLNLGMILLDCGEIELAKQYMKEALPILTAALTENNETVGRGWLRLGGAHLSTNDFEEAIKCMRVAQRIYQRLYGNNHEIVSICQEGIQEANAGLVSLADRRLGKSVINQPFDPAREIRRAAAEGTLEELEQLLANYLQFADAPDRKPESKKTPLHWAVINNRPEHVGLLLAYIGYTNLKDAKGCSALEYALQAGNAVIIDHFKTALMTHYAIHQEALLPLLVCRCVEAGDETGLKLLIHLKILVDYADENTGQTGLHLAVIKGDEKLIKLLVEAGSDPFREDFKNATPLMLAEEKDESLAVTILQIVGERNTL